VDAVGRLLCARDFRTMFVEELGWDRLLRGTSVTVQEQSFALQPVAHKRGLQVFECAVSDLDLRNRRLLREIERAVAPQAHEHVVIYVDESGRRQVWQWATRLDGDGRLLHREHAFVSHAPPPEFVEALRSLRMALDEEDALSIVDVTQRTLRAFGRLAQTEAFFRNPRFLYESDRLAQALASGRADDLPRFVLFHKRLAYWVAQPFLKLGIDPEDLGQIALVGLIEAARRFEPTRGTAFSTYAYFWIRQACHRHARAQMTALHIPLWLFWRFNRAFRKAERAWGYGGHDARSAAWSRCERDDAAVRKYGARIADAWRPASLDDPDDDAFRADRAIADPGSPDIAPATRPAAQHSIEYAFGGLDERQRDILRRHFGFDGPRQTLHEIGQAYGLTRERVRQIEHDALARLRHYLIYGLDTGRRRQRSRAWNHRRTTPPAPPQGADAIVTAPERCVQE
jgi:RNA polymerase sigma factor (sigma-70 family)